MGKIDLAKRERQRKAALTTLGVTLLRRDAVKAVLGDVGDTWLDDAMARGEFPRPVKIGPRAVAWVASEVEAYIRRCVAARDAA